MRQLRLVHQSQGREACESSDSGILAKLRADTGSQQRIVLRSRGGQSGGLESHLVNSIFLSEAPVSGLRRTSPSHSPVHLPSLISAITLRQSLASRPHDRHASFASHLDTTYNHWPPRIMLAGSTLLREHVCRGH